MGDYRENFGSSLRITKIIVSESQEKNPFLQFFSQNAFLFLH